MQGSIFVKFLQKKQKTVNLGIVVQYLRLPGKVKP